MLPFNIISSYTAGRYLYIYVSDQCVAMFFWATTLYNTEMYIQARCCISHIESWFHDLHMQLQLHLTKSTFSLCKIYNHGYIKHGMCRAWAEEVGYIIELLSNAHSWWRQYVWFCSYIKYDLLTQRVEIWNWVEAAMYCVLAQRRACNNMTNLLWSLSAPSLSCWPPSYLQTLPSLQDHQKSRRLPFPPY